MKEFDKLYFKHMFEKKGSKIQKANEKEIGKLAKDELMSYINKRKEDMSSADFTKVSKMVKDVAEELNPENIFDDLMEIGKIVGLSDSFSRVVGNVISIINKLDTPETLKTDVFGEPEAEPEAEVEPEPELGSEEPEDEEELGSEDDIETDSEEEEEEELPKKKKKKDEFDIDMDI